VTYTMYSNLVRYVGRRRPLQPGGVLSVVTRHRGNAVATRLEHAAITGQALVEAATAALPMRWLPVRFPVQAGDVDPDFLNRALHRHANGARVTQARRVGGTTGTTDRARLELIWHGPNQADLPKHVFVKSTPLTAKNRTMVAAFSMAPQRGALLPARPARAW
jgi:hypothetical protein